MAAGGSGRTAVSQFRDCAVPGGSASLRPAITMKIRSLFLCTCMTVVPITALVSHRLPGGVVQAAGGLFAAVRGTGESESACPAEPVAEVDTEGHAAAPPWTAAASVVPPTAGHALPGSPLAGHVPPRAVSDATPPDSDLPEIQRRLAATGATHVECRSLPGHGGGFTATCRVGVDAEGSLFRVFQANGSDPSSASRALLDDVQLWRERAPFRSAGRPADVQVAR